MHLTITRYKRYPDSIGVFSTLAIDGKPFGVAVENGDKLIPAGAYKLVPHDSEKHPDVVAFVNETLGVFHEPYDIPHDFNAKARVACLIHAANWPEELEGCVAPGESIARFPDRGWGVTSSRRCMVNLRELWGDRTGHTAEITEDYQ